MPKTLGCSQDTIDSFHQAAQNCCDASDLLIKTSFDIFIEHSGEILDKLIEDFHNAPPQEKAARLGQLFGHIASFYTTPLAISKVGKGLSTAAQIIGKSTWFKKTMLAAQLLNKVETAQFVKFGGKIIDQGIAFRLLKFKNQMTQLGVASHILTDEALVNGFLQATNPLAYHVNSWLESKYPKLFGEFTSSIQQFSEQKSVLKVPQGLTQKQFNGLSQLIRDKVGHISQDIFVQGSRAKGTAKAVSDIDIGIRVSAEKFDKLIKTCFGKPNSATCRENTMLHAIKVGKIRSSDIKLKKCGINLSKFKKESKKLLDMKIDISIVKKSSIFDRGPFVFLAK